MIIGFDIYVISINIDIFYDETFTLKKILDNLIIFYNVLSFKANIKPEGKKKRKKEKGKKMHRDLERTISTNF